ncbi:hypothetical protein PVL29_019417 [Vitis rotundifolia]|uniref:Retrotransposon Copia-like N-terminal domain-containing protein n=1 Tax=Vitis rotundifolia TaxID=103349 RepID=A0AA39DCP6_VITRO|nr:hypothetical protein PVL29_019417 [Vitis rotundifolia]
MVSKPSAQSSTMATSLETSSDSSFPLNPVINPSSQLQTIKLMDGNFLIWKQQAFIVIRGFDLEGFSYDISICPFEMTSSVNGSPQQNQLFVSWLLSLMSKIILPHMVGCSTASDIWRTLDKVLFAI